MEYALLTALGIVGLAVTLPTIAEYAEGRYQNTGQLGRAFSPSSSVATTVTESYQRVQSQRLPDGTSKNTILPDPQSSNALGKFGAATQSVTTDDFSKKPVTSEWQF